MTGFISKVKDKIGQQDNFIKAISLLLSGTVIAQGINVLALPMLTRIYTPADFSVFAVYTSLLMFISVASCLRFEVAIPLPNDDKEAFNLAILALISNIIISFAILCAVFLFHDDLITVINQPKFSTFIWFVPLGIFFIGLYNIVQYWATRKKNFKVIAKSRVQQSIVSVAFQIVIGLIITGAFGLVLGQIIRFSAGIWELCKNFIHDTKESIKRVKLVDLKKTFIDNQELPKYSAIESLANAAGIQLPVVIIASLVQGTEAGHLSLAMQVMALPVALIGSAISQIYLAHATEHFRNGNLYHYTIKSIKQLILIGVIPLVIISLLSPFIFPIVFGKEWVRAGEMILWMLPWFAMQLIVSPISMALYVIKKNKVALLLQIVGLIIRVGGLLLLSLVSINYLFEYYAISGLVFYFIYYIVVLLHTKQV
ncbi:oligosaccharide flippase family protein [Acinetobacter sp. YH16052]|uniref:lipopolysaccharide biosynthesis protein n=1 Tax=Acinetobacter sp. YH16052 TaxID=2601191 RepID=UPI0015D2EDF4